MNSIKSINFHEPTPDIGTWRLIYLNFLNQMKISSICEVGSGHPRFLEIIRADKKLAIDFGDDFERDFLKSNINFLNLDLDNDSLEKVTDKFDAVVCSDVFEHLLNPERTLKFCKNILNQEGIFFSHVPNEFNFIRSIKVMFLNRESVSFHSTDEQNNPHLRRFTNTGYLSFLKKEFEFNLYISDLNYIGFKKFLNKIKVPIPYGFQFGPTYISTNDLNKYKEIKKIKSSL